MPWHRSGSFVYLEIGMERKGLSSSSSPVDYDELFGIIL